MNSEKRADFMFINFNKGAIFTLVCHFSLRTFSSVSVNMNTIRHITTEEEISRVEIDGDEEKLNLHGYLGFT